MTCLQGFGWRSSGFLHDLVQQLGHEKFNMRQQKSLQCSAEPKDVLGRRGAALQSLT